MMKTLTVPIAIIGILILLASLPAAYGEGPTFEVASIKPASPLGTTFGGIRIGCSGGPGTKDPGRWTCESMNLPYLFSSAFDLRPWQLQAASPLDSERFNITAKVPEGATKEQFRQMQQNLLIERFGLKFHSEKKEMQGYELVLAKNGPKLKESEPEPPKDPASDPQKPPTPPFKMTMGKDGFPVIPPGVNGMAMMPGRASGQWIRTTMEKVAETLSGQMSKPVTNSTGLEGKYDVSLQWAPDQMGNVSSPFGNVSSPLPGMENNAPAASESSGPNLFTALQEQLGLKLQPKKVTIEIFVIDHIEKNPTEN